MSPKKRLIKIDTMAARAVCMMQMLLAEVEALMKEWNQEEEKDRAPNER